MYTDTPEPQEQLFYIHYDSPAGFSIKDFPLWETPPYLFDLATFLVAVTRENTCILAFPMTELENLIYSLADPAFFGDLKVPCQTQLENAARELYDTLCNFKETRPY